MPEIIDYELEQLVQQYKEREQRQREQRRQEQEQRRLERERDESSPEYQAWKTANAEQYRQQLERGPSETWLQGRLAYLQEHPELDPTRPEYTERLEQGRQRRQLSRIKRGWQPLPQERLEQEREQEREQLPEQQRRHSEQLQREREQLKQLQRERIQREYQERLERERQAQIDCERERERQEQIEREYNEILHRIMSSTVFGSQTTGRGYYVYAWFNRNGLFYIGKGCRTRVIDPHDGQLCEQWRLAAGSYFRYRILCDNMAESYALAVESELINRYRPAANVAIPSQRLLMLPNINLQPLGPTYNPIIRTINTILKFFN